MTSFTYTACPHCGGFHDSRCPRIKAIEYHANGAIKRIEYFEAAAVSVSEETP